MRPQLIIRFINRIRVDGRLIHFIIVLLLIFIIVLEFYKNSRHFFSDEMSGITNNVKNHNVDLSALLIANFWPQTTAMQQVRFHSIYIHRYLSY